MKEERGPEGALREQMAQCQAAFSFCLNANLPTGTDYHYYKTFEAFSESVDAAQSQLQDILLRFPRSEKVKADECFNEPEDTHLFVMDLLDEVLDRVDKAVDEGHVEINRLRAAGKVGTQETSAIPSSAAQVSGRPAPGKKEQRNQDYQAMTSATAFLRKPQSDFIGHIDNSNNDFEGKLAYWKQLAEGKVAVPERLACVVDQLDFSSQPGQPPHPLRKSIENLVYPSHALATPAPTMYKAMEDTPFHYVETLEQLQDLAHKLEGVKEVAVDLEAHSFRSFQGFTCLMQISDRQADYVIDVMKLWSQIGPTLGAMFADPQVLLTFHLTKVNLIVKVLHGSDYDINWLQRDYGIYVVNLFDTGQAARVLSMERIGYAYLLEYFCNVKTDKRYQLADWRVRPLPKEMLTYARMDTHYLLYIYDCLKVLLKQASDRLAADPQSLAQALASTYKAGKVRFEPDLLKEVYGRSQQLALQTYNKPTFRDTDYKEHLRHQKKAPPLNSAQEAVYRSLFAWRDQTARERDESWEFVISKSQLHNIALALPKTAKELRKAMGGGAPSLVLPCGQEILAIIGDAVAQAQQQGTAACGAGHDETQVTCSQDADAVKPSLVKLHTGLKTQDRHQGVLQDEQQNPSPPSIPDSALPVPPTMDKQPAGPGRGGATEARILDNAAPFNATSVQPIQMASRSGAGSIGSMIGRRQKTSAQPILASTTRPAPAGRPFGASPLQNGKALDKVAALRAGLQLPIPSAAPLVQPEDKPLLPQDSKLLERASQEMDQGEQIRAVADALISGNNTKGHSEMSEQPGKVERRQAEGPASISGDFLPLPISERYPKYQKRSHAGSKPEILPEEERSAPTDSSSESNAESEHGEQGVDDRIHAILKATGLQSDSEEDGRDSQEQDHEPHKKKQRLHPALGDGSLLKAFEVEEDRQPQQETLPKLEGSQVDGAQKEGHTRSLGIHGAPFDYSAAKASAPGLQLEPELHSSQNRGRGRRGRGRGQPLGRLQAASRASPQYSSPYKLDESKFLKGGKRSAVHQRAGNKNLTFGSNTSST